jgi:quinol monooxygenase YgiN
MSSKIYCLASFRPKPGKEEALFRRLQELEPNTLREEGCERYVVTRHIPNPFAEGDSYPIVFNETWRNLNAFEAHCARKEIVMFFQSECKDPGGMVEAYNVCVYTDEPESYDRPL